MEVDLELLDHKLCKMESMLDEVEKELKAYLVILGNALLNEIGDAKFRELASLMRRIIEVKEDDVIPTPIITKHPFKVMLNIPANELKVMLCSGSGRKVFEIVYHVSSNGTISIASLVYVNDYRVVLKCVREALERRCAVKDLIDALMDMLSRELERLSRKDKEIQARMARLQNEVEALKTALASIMMLSR